MSRKANPAWIGAFVLAGIGLAIALVLLVSSASLLTNKERYILYFDASLTGLDPGAAVKFRGVTLGSVKEVLIHFNQRPDDTAAPVLIELNESLMRKRADETFDLIGQEKFEEAIRRGLRGKLEAQSLLTGLLYVDLEFLPETPAVWRQARPLYREIPTVPMETQIFRVDFGKVVLKLNSVLGQLDQSLAELKIKEMSAAITNLLISLHAIAASPELTNTIVSARTALDEIRAASEVLRRRADALGSSAESTLEESRAALREVRGGAQEVRDALTPGGPLRRDVSDALENLSEAARSVSELADFLRRNPNALITGRRNPDAKP